jgi:hypothetical protein
MQEFLYLLVRGQRIDRRILYVLLAIIVALPFLIDTPVPPVVVSPQAQLYYDTIESIAKDPTLKDKLVILCTNYGSGTFAENQTQAEATMHHLMKRHLKFALFAFASPQGRDLGKDIADRLAPKYGYAYGRDYVHFGYRPSDAIESLLKAAVRDIPGAFGNDINGTPLEQVPVMQHIKTVNDISLIVEIASANTLPVWLQFFQRVGDHPIATLYSPTGVMAPEAFPLLKSGQLQGMLSGLNGAIEYEGLVGEKGFGTRASASLSYAHLLIILLIVLGNLGMFAQRRLARLNEEAD